MPNNPENSRTVTTHRSKKVVAAASLMAGLSFVGVHPNRASAQKTPEPTLAGYTADNIPDASALVFGLGLGGGLGDALASVSSHEGNIAPNPNFIFDGGTTDQKAKITRAINECNFNWDVLPQKVTIHFASVASGAEASPGEIWINPVLMDPKDPNDHFVDGTFQHEAMHQVDFMLLDDKDRKEFAGKFRLKIKAWTRDENPNLRHEDYGEELFADALSVACWPSKYNATLSNKSDESKAMPPPKKAMALLTSILRAKGLNAQKQPPSAQPLQVRHKINSDPISD